MMLNSSRRFLTVLIGWIGFTLFLQSAPTSLITMRSTTGRGGVVVDTGGVGAVDEV